MSSINLPQGRNLGNELSSTFSAELGMLPNLLAGQAQYTPEQAGTTLANLNYLLTGTPQLNWNTQSFTPSVRQQGNNYSYGPLPQNFTGQIDYPQLPTLPAGTVINPGSSGNGGGFGGFLGGIPGLSNIPGLSSLANLANPTNLTNPSAAFGATVNQFDPTTAWAGLSSLQNPGATLGLPQPRAALGTLGRTTATTTGNGAGNPQPRDLASGLSSFLPGLGGIFGGGSSAPTTIVSPASYSTTTNTLAPQTGLLGLQQLQEAAGIGQVASLGPLAMGAVAAANPGTAGLINTLTGQAQSQLGLGTQMDPGQLRQVSQATQAAQQGTLGGTGNAGQLGLALGLSQFGQNLYQQRLQNAGNIYNLRQSFYGDPFQRVLGQPSASMNYAANFTGSGQNALGNQLNPQSNYAADLYNTNYNAAVNQAIGNANNSNALIGAGISAFGNLAGGAMKFI